MRIRTITEYSFDELSEEAQERAVQDVQESDYYMDLEWWEYNDEDFQRILHILGFYQVETYFTGFYSQGDGACFEASYSNEKRITTKIKKHAPLDKELHRIARRLMELQQKAQYRFEGKIYRGRYTNYYHSNTMCFEPYYSEDRLSKYKDNFMDICRDLADWYYSGLERQYDYHMSDDGVRDYLIGNDYQFDINGERI